MTRSFEKGCNFGGGFIKFLLLLVQSLFIFRTEENVYSSVSTGSKGVVEGTQAELAGWWFEVVQASANFYHIAVAETKMIRIIKL
jgi:hypothetical protein